MSFDRMQHAAARQQLRLLGGVLGVVVKAGSVIDPALVLIERDVQMPTDNGLTLEKRTIASLLKIEVGVLVKNDQIKIGAETLKVSDVLADDGFVVRVFVRG